MCNPSRQHAALQLPSQSREEFATTSTPALPRQPALSQEPGAGVGRLRRAEHAEHPEHLSTLSTLCFLRQPNSRGTLESGIVPASTCEPDEIQLRLPASEVPAPACSAISTSTPGLVHSASCINLDAQRASLNGRRASDYSSTPAGSEYGAYSAPRQRSVEWFEQTFKHMYMSGGAKASAFQQDQWSCGSSVDIWALVAKRAEDIRKTNAGYVGI